MDLDLQAVMKNLLGIQPNAFEPVYIEGELVSDSEDILEEKLDVENIDCEIQHRDFDIT